MISKPIPESPASEALPLVEYGDHVITYETVRSSRTTLSILVHPDQSVEVRAPETASAEDIRGKVQKRARWIVKQQQDFASFVQPKVPREYVSGETHRYMGRQYRLKVIPVDENEEEHVKLVGPYFRIYTHQKGNRDHVKSLLDTWYREHAVTKFEERVTAACDKMRRYGVERPPVKIRKMQKRWGSCTPGGNILLNVDLIRAPRLCIDYVIIHELCHLKHPHHGPEFYNLLGRVLPDWEKIKARLRDVQF